MRECTPTFHAAVVLAQKLKVCVSRNEGMLARIQRLQTKLIEA